MLIVPKERKFNSNYFDTKIDRKMFDNMSKIEKIRFFASKLLVLVGRLDST